MQINLFSFGFKHSQPEADTVFDVRFLPNPYYVPELSSRTGLERDVSDYVLESALAEDFFRHLQPLLMFFIQSHENAGKKDLRIGIGCTGGRHRSVAVVEKLTTLLKENGITVNTFHRDIDKK
jgi:UPF0042 nucleotide-binding protein